MRFWADAPYLLQEESGAFYADWNVASDNFGYTQAEVEDVISTALNDPLGWEQVPGITFRQVDAADRGPYTVTFQVVETITLSDPYAWGITILSGQGSPFPNTRVQIEIAHFADLGIPNHEAAHAFFSATHSPEGSDSLMEPYEDPGSEAPSATDLAQVEEWLANIPEDENGANPANEAGSIIWFPIDLPDYVTSWPVPAGHEARMTASIRHGARVALQPVHAGTYADLMAGDYTRFANGVDCYHEGLVRSPWRAAPSGERFVGVIVHADNEEDLEPLRAFCEVQIRRGVTTPTRTCSPEDTITFGEAAPGRLTLEDGQYYGDYQIAPDSFGYTEAEARAIVSSALEGGGGWSKAGIIFRETVGAPVTFRFVHGPFDCGGVMANGCTTPSGGTALVELSYERAEAGYGRNLVNHESGHAYFGATHSGNGIMVGESIRGFPSACDIRSVADWLGI